MNLSNTQAQGALAVSPSEAARLIGIGRSSVYAKMKAGDLPYIKLGKRRLIRVSAIEALLDAHEVRCDVG